VTFSYFATYEIMKKWLIPADPKDLSLSAIIFAGGTAGVAMWTIAIPPDVSIVVILLWHLADEFIFQVIKSRIQSAATGTYSGFLDCVRKTIAVDGIGALWRGLGPAMARAFPANAAAFVSLIETAHECFRI
jgi:solute carrier family 25 carnitine/acylcarnitine transporter 20/29